MLNINLKKIIPFALIGTLLLSGCNISTTLSDDTVANDAFSQTVNTVKNEASADDDISASDVYDAAFTQRDLSGEYDEDEAVYITLSGDSASCDEGKVTVNGSDITITEEGTYILSGDLNGSVIIDATKEDKIQLVLDNAHINSDDFAAIYVKQADKVFITLSESSDNSLSNSGEYVQIDDNDVDAVIFAKDDITLNGSGNLKITASEGNGISGKDEVTITGGTYEINASKHAIRAKDTLAIADGTFKLTAGEDGLHAENSDDETLGSIYISDGDFTIEVKDDAIHANTFLQIDNGTFDITAAEGLEATYIRINDGNININASDDGINAAYKSSAYVPTFEINAGSVTIKMAQGDTDGVDSNGNIIINGGTLDITGQSAFDYDGNAQYNGGTLIVNGQQVSSIPNQMMGGGGQGGMMKDGAREGFERGNFENGDLENGSDRRQPPKDMMIQQNQ